MKYIFQFLLILAFCLAGELLHELLTLPVPASIYGLLLLLLALKCAFVRLDQIRETGHFLTGIFLVLFIPATVGIIDSLDVLRGAWLSILLALFPVTILVFFVSGRVTETVLGRDKHA